MNTFDIFGWYSADQYPNRQAPVAPANTSLTTTDGEMRANWTGYAWVDMPYVQRDVPVPVSPVPEEVTMRQARLALLQNSPLVSVDAAIAALPSPQKEAATIEWEYSSTVQRRNGFVEQIGPALGFSDAQLDDLFRLAATL